MGIIYIASTIIKIIESIIEDQKIENQKWSNGLYKISEGISLTFHPKYQDIVKLNGSSLIGNIEIEGRNIRKCFDIITSYNGYAIMSYYYNKYITTVDELNSIELGKVFLNLEDYFSNILPSAEIVCDPFTNNKNLIWANNFSYQIRLYPSLGVTLEYKDNNSFICFSTSKKYKLHQGDTISLLFENGGIVDFPIQKTVIHDEACSAYCSLFREDVELFIKERCGQYRITYCKSDKAPLVENFTDKKYSPYEYEMFVAYAKHYLNELNRLMPDYHLPQRAIIKTPVEYKFPGCYVYLMLDNSNGYHKIGISNTPEYREKTLQSEKPSIELLAYKKFPTRKIAEAIESALHTAYSQQRLRGEWFKLDDVDVAAIIETLK